MIDEIEIVDLPFYWRLSPENQKTGNIVEDRLPFRFGVDELTGLLIQRRNKSVLKALEAIYKQEYNIGYLQDANEIARPYGEDFIRYLKSALSKNPSLKSILEVGCGGCVVLGSLKEDGYEVLGIDSSPFAAAEGGKKGVDVVTDFFPTEKISKQFDLIFHVDVLEHISNPVDFLKSHRANLSTNGMIIVNVPDVTESIEIGDVSMAMHQHLNYFTEKSLKATLQAAGFDVVSIEKAKYGGSLYATGVMTDAQNISKDDLQALLESYNAFVTKASGVLENFGALSRRLLSENDCQLGYYVPLRALPYISAHGISSGFRFFDDTNHWHNCVFDGVDVRIENFDDLKKKPVTHMIVMSLTFGETIRNKIRRVFADRITVVTLADLAGKK